jgi:hypothetical protein
VLEFALAALLPYLFFLVLKITLDAFHAPSGNFSHCFLLKLKSGVDFSSPPEACQKAVKAQSEGRLMAGKALQTQSPSSDIPPPVCRPWTGQQG